MRDIVEFESIFSHHAYILDFNYNTNDQVSKSNAKYQQSCQPPNGKSVLYRTKKRILKKKNSTPKRKLKFDLQAWEIRK